MKRIQKIIGSLLYYGRAIDPTILVALGTLATQQNEPTKNTEKSHQSGLGLCSHTPKSNNPIPGLKDDPSYTQ